jgi:hypothetical protein
MPPRQDYFNARDEKVGASRQSRWGQDFARLRHSYLLPTRHCGYSLPAQAICNNLAIIDVKSGLGSKQKGIVPWQL